MFRFLCRRQRTVVPCRDLFQINSTIQLDFVQNTFSIVRLVCSSSQAKKRPTTYEENEHKQSFTVSYLMNKCGLSKESAFSASNRVSIKNAERADSVLGLLRDHGFTDIQISKVVRIYPEIILRDAERNLLPKIEFFRSIGVSRSDISKVVSSSPHLLASSLRNRLIPNYKSLKNIVVLDENVVRVLKRYPRQFLVDVESNLAPNLALLREIGMPQSRILFLMVHCSVATICKHSKFCKIVNEVQKMGFNPLRTIFVFAIQAISQMKKSVWESKIEVYRRWGLSKDEILYAFKRHPYCMLISEEKITKAMDFYVHKMGWLSQDLAKAPEALLFSLEKRIVPRCSVVKVLLSKRLIKEDISPSTFLLPGESTFMRRYVTKFQEKIPQLLNVYRGKKNLLDVRPDSERYVE